MILVVKKMMIKSLVVRVYLLLRFRRSTPKDQIHDDSQDSFNSYTLYYRWVVYCDGLFEKTQTKQQKNTTMMMPKFPNTKSGRTFFSSDQGTFIVIQSFILLYVCQYCRGPHNLSLSHVSIFRFIYHRVVWRKVKLYLNRV